MPFELPKSWKILMALGSALLLLAWGAAGVRGQEGSGEGQGPFEEVPIITTASRVVGIGSYVAAEAYAVPAGEDPAAQPMQAIIMPYGIDPDMQVNQIDDFTQPAPAVEGFTFAWSLAAPDGSTAPASLIQGTVGIFMADVEGRYDLTLTATDAGGTTASTVWTVYATTYVGVGGLDGQYPQFSQCSFCHEKLAAAWSGTGHASIFTRAIDGQVSAHYGPNCVSCHTTGFNNRPEAVNGGFDDLALDSGWVFPAELEDGNWVALVQDMPEVAGMSNIQCESCHGPGSLHVNESTPKDPMIARGLESGVCAQCHAEGPHHILPQQWELSAHADQNAEAFWYPIGEDHLDCVSCHSGAGYIDTVQGVPQEARRTDYQVITCAVCHDPHHAENPSQLRVYDQATLPDGTAVTGAGPAALCMTCHNARTDPVAAVEGDQFTTPHGSPAAELMSGTGGYTWGMKLPSSPHGRIVENSCVTCHMASSPGVDDSGTPDDPNDDIPLLGHNTVGGHTFAMISPVDGTANTTACQNCHAVEEGEGSAGFEFEAEGDYDGDGTTETNQQEVAGLRDLLKVALEAQGVTILDRYPYFNIPDGAGTDILGAVYNYQFTADVNASTAHNLHYTVALLQLSYEKLAGSPVPNAEILAPQ